MRTPQQAMKDAIESGAVQAWIDGKPIEYTGDPTNHWTKFRGEEPPHFNTPIWHWRPAPEPKLRPWKPEEVPLDAWYRGKNGIAFRIAFADLGESAIAKTVANANGGHVTLDHVFKEWTHSTDGGKTWAPCGVMEGGE